MFNLLHRSPLMTRNGTIHMITLGRNVNKSILLPMSFNHQFMGIVVDVDICSIHHDIIRVAEKLCHLFQWNAFGFWEDECEDEGSETADDDEDLMDLLESFSRRKIGSALPDRISSRCWRTL